MRFWVVTSVRETSVSKSRTTVAASWPDARPLALLGAEKVAGSSPSVSFFHELLDFPALPKFLLAQGPKAGKPSTMNSVTLNLREVVTLVSAAPGKVICEMKVEEEHTNTIGTLHGGLTATLVDNISTMALLCTERGAPGVSVDMNITYMSPAKLGEDIVITAHVLKQGKTLAFASVDLTNKVTGKLIAQGRHTKHLGN
uniref:Acyl-coenzyme A thioesterase 13 n=1 Tax=Papio anubis TaxID=9555 RepID=A0A096N647_PAPAN